jgi:hypothetical protein
LCRYGRTARPRGGPQTFAARHHPDHGAAEWATARGPGGIGKKCGSFLASFDNRILKRHAFRIIFLKPFFCRLFVGKDLR